jgi:transcription antitermination factor NusG
MYWFAVHVQAGHEAKVKRFVEKRRKELDGFLGEVVAVPSLPGYLFVEAADWPSPALEGLSRYASVVGVVEPEEVARLRGLPWEPPPAFRAGDLVKVVDGPFAGLGGKVVRAGLKRVKVALFEGELKVDLDASLLKSL